MAKNRVSLGMDIQEAVQDLDAAQEAVDDGAKKAVQQLAVMAEDAMKEEAPEGATGDLRDSIDTRFRRNGLTANVGARKKTADGGLLAEIIVEGTDGSSYDPSPGLVKYLGKQMEDWAAAKLGDESLGYAVAWSITRSGHKTLPNDFVDDSLDKWEDEVEAVAGAQVQAAMTRLMGGG